MFRSHRGFRKGGAVFRAHANKALTVKRAKAARPWKGPKAAAFRAAGRHKGFPARHRAMAYKSAGRHAPASWVKARRKAAKYRAARAKRV